MIKQQKAYSLILPRISEKEIPHAISLLKEKELLESESCAICKCNIEKENFGGFLPNKKTKKISLFCDKLSCRLDSFFLIRKNNGNGSPFIE